MLLDDQNTFFDNANLDAATANLSDIIDMGAPVDLGGFNPLGSDPMEVWVKTGTEGNADNTLALKLEGANEVAFDTTQITVAEVAAADIGGNGQIKRLAIPHHAPRRYFRLTATTAGTTSTNTGFQAYLKSTLTQRGLAGSPTLI